MSGVYAIRVHAEDNIGYYVGATGRTISRRWQEHRKDLIAGDHFNLGLQQAWLEYGPSCFSVVLLEAVNNPAHLDARERYWIEKIQPEFNTTHNDVDYDFVPSHWNPNRVEAFVDSFRRDDTNGLNYFAERQYAQRRRDSGYYPLS